MNLLTFTLFGLAMIVTVFTCHLYHQLYRLSKETESKNEVAYAFTFGTIIFLISVLSLITVDYTNSPKEKLTVLITLIIFLSNGALNIWVKGMYALTQSKEYKNWVIIVRLIAFVTVTIIGISVYKIVY
ncbi:hypothetical protein ACQUY5_26880 [Bacillus cereus]|uniref:hypothetical protein n=1 Tax=Bacillus cereus TaxID=1396 RepID=UPI003D17CE7A